MGSTMWRRLREVADHGVPLGPSLRATPLWRASHSGKIHTYGSCPRLRGRAPGRVEVDVVSAAAEQWCSHCADKGNFADTELVEWLNRAELAIRSNRAVEAGALVEVRNLLSEMVAARRDAPEDLHVVLDDAIAAAHAALEQVSGTEARQRAVRAAVARSMGRGDVPAGTTIEVCFSGNYGRHLTSTAWKAMCRLLTGGHDVASAVDSARSEVQNRLEEEFAHERVPATAALDPTAFSHPHDWARAEWLLAAQAELEANLALWADAVTAACTDTDEVTLLVNWTRLEEDDQALLLAFDPVFDPEERYALVSAPAVVARVIQKQGQWGEFVARVLAKQPHTEVTLEVALAMIDRSDLDTAPDMLSAAKLITAA